MRKEMYSVECPKRVRFGDPMYFGRFTGKKLSDLVVDFSPPPHFAARLALEEKEMKEFPGVMDRTMKLCLAPEKTIKTYTDGFMYEGQEHEVKDIGVDTARYLFDVDGRSNEISTGGDGYWGACITFYHSRDGKRFLDAAIVIADMPEFTDFEEMKRMASYFFTDMQPIQNMEESKSQQIKME